jgi:hypothetical protein
MKKTLLATILLLTSTVLTSPLWGAEAVNPPRPAPVAVGVIGISIVVPPRDSTSDQSQGENDAPDRGAVATAQAATTEQARTTAE